MAAKVAAAAMVEAKAAFSAKRVNMAWSYLRLLVQGGAEGGGALGGRPKGAGERFRPAAHCLVRSAIWPMHAGFDRAGSRVCKRQGQPMNGQPASTNDKCNRYVTGPLV